MKEMWKKQKRNNKGITLIALVVTIIVLLILVGVSISTLIGDNGIITKANRAKEQSKIAEYREELILIRANLEIELAKKTLLKEEYMKKYKQEIAEDKVFERYQKLEMENKIIELITKEGYIFKISENDVIYVGKQGEALEDIITSLSVLEKEGKEIELTAKIENAYGREYNYKIVINGEEVVNSKSKSGEVKYQYKTEFGMTEGYIEIEYNGKTTKSNTIKVEDNKIENKQELETFRNNVNNGNSYEGKIVTQISNIDLQGNQTSKWTPIGNETTPFKGTYDGGNHFIQNLYINTNEKNQGLFGKNEGTIKNVGIESGSIIGGSFTGSIVGINVKGTIERCYNKVGINATGAYVGGICGNNLEGKIRQCYNAGDIVGNIIIDSGKACGISPCIYSNTESISATIEECYNTGNITLISEVKNSQASGIAGTMRDGPCLIKSCYNTGIIKNISENEVDRYAVAAGIATQVGNQTIENCYNIGLTIIEAKSGENELRRAGICGYIYQGAEIKNCYYLIGTANKGIGEFGPGASGGTAEVKSIEEMKQMTSILGDKFKEDTNNINNGYPILKWQ